VVYRELLLNFFYITFSKYVQFNPFLTRQIEFVDNFLILYLRHVKSYNSINDFIVLRCTYIYIITFVRGVFFSFKNDDFRYSSMDLKTFTLKSHRDYLYFIQSIYNKRNYDFIVTSNLICFLFFFHNNKKNIYIYTVCMEVKIVFTNYIYINRKIQT